MPRKPTAIIVGGNDALQDALSNALKQWDFVDRAKSISAFSRGLDDGSITSDLEIVLLVDRLFVKSKDESFENLVVELSPFTFFGILDYSDVQDEIREAISKACDKLRADHDDLNYYFIGQKNALAHFNDAIEDFIAADREDARDTIAVLKGEEPNEDDSSELDTDDEETEETPEPEIDDDDELEVEEGFEFESEDEEDDSEDVLGHTISMSGSKGGAGKSSMTATLASVLVDASKKAVEQGLAERPLKVLVWDMDVTDGQIGFLTGNSSPTVVNLHKEGINKDSLDKNIIHDENWGIDLLLAAKRPMASKDITSEWYADLLKRLRKRYDYILIDTSVNYMWEGSHLEKVCYRLSDLIVFTTEPNVSSVNSMTRWLIEVTSPESRRGMAIPVDKIGVAVNKSIAGADLTISQIQKSAKNRPILAVFPSIPRTFAEYANSLRLNEIVNDDRVRTPAFDLAKSIVGDQYPLVY